jgi:hypothetical protein
MSDQKEIIKQLKQISQDWKETYRLARIAPMIAVSMLIGIILFRPWQLDDLIDLRNHGNLLFYIYAALLGLLIWALVGLGLYKAYLYLRLLWLLRPMKGGIKFTKRGIKISEESFKTSKFYRENLDKKIPESLREIISFTQDGEEVS